MGVVALVTDIIQVGTSTLVFSKTSKVIGQKDISEMIKFAGLTCIGLDLFLLTKPLIDFVIRTGETIAIWTERISEALSWIGM